MLAVALLVATLGTASAAPHLCGPQVVESFTVETEWSKKAYRQGETAKVRVTVTRPGPEDPANQGIPMPDTGQSTPAEEVELSTAMHGVFPPVAGYGTTDANGEATLRFKIPEGLSGPWDTFTSAKKYYATGGADCTDVEERGSKFDSPAFTVKD